MTQATSLSVLLIGDALHLEYRALLHDGWQATLARPDEVTDEHYRGRDLLVIDADPANDIAQASVAAARGAGFLGPVLYLTDREDVTGVAGIGDGFLARPYSLEQLAASLRELARFARTLHGDRPDPVLRVGELVLDENTHEVHRAGDRLEITTTEYELLRFLMRHPGRVFSKQQILDRVWTTDYSGKITVVEPYISYLRKKIDSGRDEAMVLTMRNAGYRLKTHSKAD